MDRLRDAVSKHIINKDNICLVVSRQCVSDWRYIFLSKFIIESNLTGTAGRFGSGNFFPLYLYPDTKGQQSINQTTERTPNLNTKIVEQLAKKLGLTFTTEKDTSRASVSASKTFAPIDILDYIYAVLHSPTYREKYKEFLKIDFPRVPYPKDNKTFWQLVKLGGEIRQIHLLESPTVKKYTTQYPIDGSNVVGKISFVSNSLKTDKIDNVSKKVASRTSATTKKEKISSNYSNTETTYSTDNVSFPQPHLSSNNDQMLHEPEAMYHQTVKGKVYINDTQYFDNVPEVAWNFYIGGYQPAQKWLKDRKDRKLEFEDILHYQKIIVALSETDRLMKEIDEIIIE